MPGKYGRKQFNTSTITYCSPPPYPLYLVYPMHIASTPWQAANSHDDDMHQMISIVDWKTCRCKGQTSRPCRLDPDPGDGGTIT